jgi:ERCC4-related helicase
MTTKTTAPVQETLNTNLSVVENTTQKTAQVAKDKKSNRNKTEKEPKPQFNWAKGFETVANQEKGQSYKSELLTAKMVAQLKANMDLVIKAIKSGTEHDKEIASYLLKIETQLTDTATEKYGEKNKKQITRNVKSAIKELAERNFRFKSSRAFEYIRLADNGAVIALDLPISHLIELSRLKKDTDDLKNLLAVKTIKELDAMKYLEIQAVVKEFNSFKRKSKTAKLETAPAPVNEFKKFIGGFDKVQKSLDKKSLTNDDLKKIKALAEWANEIIKSHQAKVA